VSYKKQELLILLDHQFFDGASSKTLLLNSETYPDLWRENFIKPIFKGGCINDPSKYRGVALSSCFGNFFSKILSNKLDKFLEENNIICSEQIGFKKHCRTSDHILTLKSLINKAFKLSNSLCVCFIALRSFCKFN
jgi:hypothetical protein